MYHLLFGMFLLFLTWGTKILADPIEVRPVAPIYKDTSLIGFTSTDPVAEFKVPDMWTLKKDGVIKRTLSDGSHELIIQVEPFFPKSEERERDLVNTNEFNLFLPIPFFLSSAQLYINDSIADLKAEFVPYPGNTNKGFYFRLSVSSDKLDICRMGVAIPRPLEGKLGGFVLPFLSPDLPENPPCKNQ